MFQFRRCPPHPLWIQGRVTSLLRPGFPIRIPTDHCSLAAPRGVSPLAASFIGTLPQGIRHVPFSASYQDLRTATLIAIRAISGPVVAGPARLLHYFPSAVFKAPPGEEDAASPPAGLAAHSNDPGNLSKGMPLQPPAEPHPSWWRLAGSNR